MSKKTIKKFRLNVVISYRTDVNLNNFRPPIQSLIKHLAWLYRLEYSIQDDYKGFDVSDLEFCQTTDMIFLRSTEHTETPARYLRKLLLDIFYPYRNWLLSPVEVFYQTQVGMKGHPFPSEYIRPINYPYLEVHKDGHKQIYIPEEALRNLLPDEDLNS